MLSMILNPPTADDKLPPGFDLRAEQLKVQRRVHNIGPGRMIGTSRDGILRVMCQNRHIRLSANSETTLLKIGFLRRQSALSYERPDVPVGISNHPLRPKLLFRLFCHNPNAFHRDFFKSDSRKTSVAKIDPDAIPSYFDQIRSRVADIPIRKTVVIFQ